MRDCRKISTARSGSSRWNRYDDLQLAANYATIEGASHWGLVLSRRVLPAIVSTVIEWLERTPQA